MSADDTMDVFGEAFMRLVRERLDLQVAMAANRITITLFDNGAPEGKGVISTETIVLNVITPPPVAPPVQQPLHIVAYRG